MMFYSQNTFILPPGQDGYAECWAATLRPEYKKMVQSLHLRITWEDLKPEGFLGRLASVKFLPSGEIALYSLARLDFPPDWPFL